MIDLIKNNLKIIFYKKSTIFIYFVSPIIVLMGVYFLINLNLDGNIKVSIVNNDNQKLSKEYINSLEKNKNMKLYFDNEKTAKSAVFNQNVHCAIIIPKGFTRSVYMNKIKRFETIYIKDTDITNSVISRTDTFLRVLDEISKTSHKNISTFYKIYNKYKKNGLAIQIYIPDNFSNFKYASPMGIGFLIMFMLSASTFISNRILLEKQNRTFYRISCTPIGEFNYLIANIITNFIVIIVQIITVTIVFSKILKLAMHASMVSIFLVLASFGLVSIGIGLLIVAFSKTSMQANSIGILIVVPISMLGGCFWPIGIMPEFLQKISNFMPPKWALEAIAKLQYRRSLYEVSINILILLAFALVFFSLAIYKFKTNDDVRNVV